MNSLQSSQSGSPRFAGKVPPKADEAGIIHTIPLLVIIAAVGIISFLLISSTLPLGGLFGILNPKPQSKAADLIPPPFPNCQPFGGVVPIGQAVPPYNSNTKLGGLEAEPLGPTWCFPLAQMPTTRVSGDNEWVDDFNTGIQMGRLNDGDMGYRVFEVGYAGNFPTHMRQKIFVNANHWMVDFGMIPSANQPRPGGAVMISPNRTFHAENGTLVIESDVAITNDGLGGADNFVEIDVAPQAAPDASRDYYGYGSFTHGAFGCRFEKSNGSITTVCSQYSPWPVIPLPITETPAGNCANLPDRNGQTYNCLSDHSTPDSNGAGNGNRLWETQGAGCSWMGGCAGAGDLMGSTLPGNGLRGRDFARNCLAGQMDYFCRDRIRMEISKTQVLIYINGGLAVKLGPLPAVIPAASNTAPGRDGRIADGILNNASVYFTHWINDTSSTAFVSRTHWDRIAINPHDLPGHFQPPTSAPSYCPDQPNNTCPILTQITANSGINVPAQNTVEMLDFVYNQEITNTTVGSTITFVNKGTQPHSATANDGSWDTGILNPGQSKTITFSAAGVFAFYCIPHPTMTGTVTVYPINGNLPTPPPGSPTSSASPAPTVVTTFNATLNGASETPINNSSATGTSQLQLLSNNTARVSLSFSGLSSSQTAAHIHGPAAAGVGPAPIIVGVPNGNFTNQIVTFTPAQVADLRAGLYYINVHSSNFTAGEIRGQLTTSTATPPPPSTPAPTPCTKFGDTDCNGRVDIQDFNNVISDFAKTGPGLLGDLDDDNDVDIQDFNEVVSFFNT